ncbi:MAG: TerB family tellurite resistance protein [Ardenticatenaceae bacterium]|nr:TerB family tellurite resistance protein [Anaerolineales bacterium]MCB8941091.1 TerB family tellurite resistance protein [Ardenticatenaceae bacterium]MCB8972432.1 TerB family tellurite resistance protein [Ardenticatenaceae bacterium]
MTKQNVVNNEKESKEVTNTLRDKLAENMMGMFELVISDRSGHYAKHPDDIPNLQSVPSIIHSYSMTNAAVSGGASLVPGPWGMVAVIPEIAVVIRNQLAMIYDVGMAYGKDKVLSKELLAGVLLTAMGAGTGSLLVMHGSKVLVKRVALRQFQRIIAMLAGKITQQALKSAIGKWLPFIGAAALAVWSNYLTRQVGKKAIEIFEKEIVLSEDIIEEMSLESESATVQTATTGRVTTLDISPDMPKVQTLANLMKVDGTIKAEEREYLQTIISNADLTESEKQDLTQSIDNNGKFVVDYSAFACSPDDAIGLLVDMVTLAKRDGTFHITEKMFIRRVGKLLGFSDDDLEETMAVTD